MPTKEEIKKFSLIIEELSIKLDCDYLDAILHYCMVTEFEVEIASTLLSP